MATPSRAPRETLGTSVGERRRLTVEARRERLLDAAEAEFGCRPATDVSVAGVAAAAGVSPPLIHHYFGGLTGLFRAMVSRTLERLSDATVVRKGEPGPDRLREGLRAHVRFAAQHSVGYRALAGGTIGDDAIATLCEQARWRSLHSVLDALGIDEPPAALRVALRGWQGFVEAVILEWLTADALSEDEVVEMMAEALAPLLELASHPSGAS